MNTVNTTAAAIESFTADAALDVLGAALSAAGVSGTGDLRLLQDPSDNAVVHVPGLGLVARIAASADHRMRLGRELAVAAWLARHGVPVVRPAQRPPTPQLAVIRGRVVSWWEFEPSTGTASYGAHGAMLARLHTVPAPSFLPRLRPWARTGHQIALAAAALPGADVDRLRTERARLAGLWTASPWPAAPAQLIHGDPYIGNSLTAVHGGTLLLDFEDAAAGPPAWDFASVLGAHRLGWVGAGDWRAFCDGYGADLTDEPAMSLMVEVLAFRRCCWLASTTGRNGAAIQRARHRIATLSLPLDQRHW